MIAITEVAEGWVRDLPMLLQVSSGAIDESRVLFVRLMPAGLATIERFQPVASLD